jgi:hypothetical protein
MHQIIANYLFEDENCQIVLSKPKRNWMDETTDRFAYRCLPMSIVNQVTWDVLCPSTVKAHWNGGNHTSDLVIEYPNDTNFQYAKSEFGYGVLTFHTDFVLTTDNTICIYCKGPANLHKKNIQPLEGIIETFWLPFTFTMNWKFEEPGTIVFEKDEIMFSFFPIDLNFVEKFDVLKRPMNLDSSLHTKYQTYANSRTEHIDSGNTDGETWQKYYMRGVCPFSNKKHPQHKTKLNLKDFK